MFRSTKTFHFLPCAHRQWRDEGHCRFVHGYDRSVHLVFECSELDDKMWVMDFGGLKPIKAWLEDLFDHTLLINEDDPELEFFQEMEKRDLCRLRVMPNVGMEGSAKYVFEYNQTLDTLTIHHRTIHKYLNRSCGYVSNFIVKSDTEISKNHGWIREVSILNDSIFNEEKTNILIHY